MRRLGDFRDAKNLRVEMTRGILPAGRHCQLDVVESFDPHHFLD